MRAIERALRQFNKNVPHAKDVRDVLEHFDDYMAGTGRLQELDDIEWEGLAWSSSARGELEPRPANELRLDVRASAEAESDLGHAVIQALDDAM